MDQLKKQISESFFNPVLYFLPLIVFIVGNNFWGLSTAWKVSFPVAIGMIIYVHFFYNRLLTWYIILAASYACIGLIYSLLQEYKLNTPFFYYADEVLFVLCMLSLLVFQKKLHRIARKTLHPRMPMTNNLDELVRVSRTLSITVSVFTILFLILQYKYHDINHHYIKTLNYIYLVSIMLIILYEIIRVSFIRNRLIKEDWIPIITKQGKIVGSELYLNKVFGERKYTHPVIRMHIIDDGKILLQRHNNENHSGYQLWDTPINTHVRIGESIQQALYREVKSMYGVELKNTVFLSNYSHENNVEFEYVFLFVTCKFPPINFSNNDLTTKWWTPKQIKENFESGIFTEEFKCEYKLLERGGVIFSAHCVCDCELKELVKKQKPGGANSELIPHIVN
ncbi:conserved membrane hypothetical protein [uncultured Paludibacter sp.]|uniref:Nudix hydrolase domain-containing protein n=1 Tax=uncultured Paludibacter sp. TaxID=497635 RepID=A0A653A9L1_9BACT|nr:conserved membrane hypothetical protein [uncultured Paludibacter sp.]